MLGNSNLEQLANFSKLNYIENIAFNYASSLTNLHGFENLKSISQLILDESNISSLVGLFGLEKIDGIINNKRN